MDLEGSLSRRGRLHYFPIALPLVAFLFLLILFLLVMIQVGAISYVYEGIGVPIFVPPVVATFTTFVLARDAAPALAYCGGTLGTLIGADLLNLRRIRAMGAPVASIGGAGTFDGIFLTGILAVLLA